MPANARAERVALLLAQGWSVRRAARKCGVHERTVRRWQSGDEFNRLVAKLRQDVTERALGVITGGLTAAATELRRLLKAPDGRVRLSACKAIIEQQTRLAALCDLADRIAALEAESRRKAKK